MATEFNIDTFRGKLNGGSKANLFRMDIEGLPNDIVLDEFSVLCKSGAIPAFTLGVIEVPFRGRRIKIPGDRTYGDWTATFVNDDKQDIRKNFDKWLASIVDPDGGKDLAGDNSEDYRCTLTVNQLKPDGTVARVYKLFDAFPTDVSAIDLSYDTTDAVQEFTVTFQYHYLDVGVGDGDPEAGTSS